MLPTGFGKSDLFILAPLIMDVLDQDKPHYALVIVPLFDVGHQGKVRIEGSGGRSYLLFIYNNKNISYE